MSHDEGSNPGSAGRRAGSPPVSEAEFEALFTDITAAIGADGVSRDPDLLQRHASDWSGIVLSEPRAVIRPRTTEAVAAVLRLCNAAGQAVVVQGGRTGLAGGASAGAGEVALSLDRMTAIAPVDRTAGTITVEAGATLGNVQAAAVAEDLFYAVDLGARGTAAIGGTIATNAGGIRVLRYGMTREQVLGLEVVLADGTILSDMSGIVKNNTGVDLKQLFIGSEGTLGVVTRGVLKLHPLFKARVTAWASVADDEALPLLLAEARARLGGSLGAFEPMWPDYLQTMQRRMPRFQLPLPVEGPALIVECLGADERTERDRLEAFLADMIEAGHVTDAVFAETIDQERRIWAIRDDVPAEYPVAFAQIIPFDVSIPIAAMTAAVREIRSGIEAVLPDADLLFYGHLGDANLHVVIGLQEKLSSDEKLSAERIVYDLVRALGGSVSAEHGIGRLKRPWLGHTRSDAEIATMRRLKAALDPNGILNAGRAFVE
jgi:FAD/FMN-containing dehydrogenase